MGRGFGHAAGAILALAVFAPPLVAGNAPSFTNVTSGTGLTGRIGYRRAVGDIDGDIDFTEIFLHGGTQRGKYSGPVRNDAGVFNWGWTRVIRRGWRWRAPVPTWS